jgi:hypothetical protein
VWVLDGTRTRTRRCADEGSGDEEEKNEVPSAVDDDTGIQNEL